MIADVATSRIVQATTATIQFQGVDSDGEPGDPGTVTVHVTDSQGNDVLAAGTATSGTGTDPRTVALTVEQTAAIDRLTAAWSVGSTVVGSTVHDVVGGVYCTLKEIRGDGSALKQQSQHPRDELIADRTEVEYQFESVCRRAFVPRFRSEEIESRGSRRLILGWPDLREVVWADYWDGTAWVAVSNYGVDVTQVSPSDAGLADLPDNSTCWPSGRVRVGYRYGWDRPPADLQRAAVKATRARRHQDRSGIEDRATVVTVPDVGTMQLATPGMGQWVTAIPEVDEALKRYKFVVVGVA